MFGFPVSMRWFRWSDTLAPSYVFTPLIFVTRHRHIHGGCVAFSVSFGLVVSVTKSTGHIDISISKPNGLVACHMASAPKKDKKTNLEPTDKDNPKKIRRSEWLKKLFQTSYMFNQVPWVTLHDQILGMRMGLCWVWPTVWVALQ